MKPITHAWGTRLSDAMRDALRCSDTNAAHRLALQGDAQARDLAREYAFMARGLRFTLQVLFRLLLETRLQGRAQADEVDQAIARTDDGLVAILRCLLHGLRAGANSTVESPRPDASPERLSEACLQSLNEAHERFARDQAHRAGQIVQALSDGHLKEASALLDAKDTGWLELHDPMVRFMADSFAWVLRTYGEDSLLDFHLATAEGQRGGFEKWEQMTAAEFAATTAFLLRQHMGQVQVQEDDQRFTVTQSPCGSGGRFRLDGAYSGSDALPFVDVPGPLTFGERCMPVYCTHCAIWNGTATLRWFGRAQWVFDQPARADGGCTLHIYKRREDAPAEYSRRVALPATRVRT